MAPADFISILENAGLIYRLDRYVWEEAAKILKRWKGTTLAPLFISVNVSPQDDKYLNIEQVFVDLTKKYGLTPGQLKLEFTETTLISNPRHYIKLISSLRQNGFCVEIDDFGSGYSSLNMLHDIKADVLKLDRLFVGKTDNIERNQHIMASIIEMSKKLDMQVIAEGVETEALFDYLSGINCDLFQGFFFSKPIPLEEFERTFR